MLDNRLMRISVVWPGMPTPAVPDRERTHSELLRLYAAAGHDVRAIVPLGWPSRHWLAGGAFPAEERVGPVEVVHPRYLKLPRIFGDRALALERRAFSEVAAVALASVAGDPDVLLCASVALPGGLIGRHRGAKVVVLVTDGRSNAGHVNPGATLSRDP